MRMPDIKEDAIWDDRNITREREGQRGPVRVKEG